MAHLHLDEINLKLARLLDVRRSARPWKSDSDAVRLLFSTQDALHALACARDHKEVVVSSNHLPVRETGHGATPLHFYGNPPP